MTIGSPFARPWRDGANILRTLLSLLLSCALALSLAPSAAWAASGEVGDAAVGDVPAPAVPSDGQPAAQADESPAPDDPAPDSSADGTLDAVPPSADESPSGSVAGGSVAGTEAAGGPGEGSGAPDVADGREGSAASAENARTLDAVVSQNASSLAGRAASSLTASCFASITSSPSTSSPQIPAGFQYAGTTLYASAWKSSSSKVGDDGTWTYNWYTSSTRSPSSLASANLIEGQHGSALTLTDEMAGSYLFVEITSGDGITVSGPRQANRPTGKLYGVGLIKKAIPAKTALDEHSYILVQDSTSDDSPYASVEAASLHAGQSLSANAYDSEASPSKRIVAQSSWAYQWLAGDSRDAPDSEYRPIDGQTGQTLTITEALAEKLAGKYIRVKVTGDGQELYGPSGVFDRPGSNEGDTPGPVVAADQIMLNHVVLAYNGADFGNEDESVPSANVGDTIAAAAYYLDGYTPTDLYRGDKVDFSWQVASSADGAFAEVATGDTYTVEDKHAGKYLRVVATARNGVPGHDAHATEPGRILAKGVTTLYSVSILNTSRAALDTGTTLEAMAYRGDYWDQTAVTEGVTYTWRWADEDPSSYDFDGETGWHVVGGVTGDSFTVPEGFEGRWVSVSAYAGDNVVSSPDDYAAGPFKKPGTFELYTVGMEKRLGDMTERFVYKAGETVGVTARATSASGTAGEYLTDDQITCTWMVSDSRFGDYRELADENVHKPSFVIPASYAGKYLKCNVSAGFNTESVGMSNAIVEAPEQTAVAVARVELAGSGAANSLVPGDKIIARAYDAAGEDVTDQITADRWSWGTATEPSAGAVNVTFLKGNYEANVLTAVPDNANVIGKYVVAQVSNESVTGDKKKVKGVSAVVVSAVPAPVYELSSLGVASSGQLTQVGDTVTPEPLRQVGSGEWAYEDALPSDAVVAYTWYAADDAAGANARAVSGADAASGALLLTEDLQGAYLYVEANAGANTVRSKPFLVESAAAQHLTVNAQVIGTTRHKVGEPYSAEAWIPLSEYTWSSDVRTTAWDVFAKLLDDAGYHYDLTGGTPYSITTPDKAYTLAMSASAPWSYWSFYVNGAYASTMASSYVLKDGDTIELRYFDASSTEVPSGDIEVDPDVALPDWDADWPGYGNGGSGSAVTTAPTPADDGAELSWAFDYSSYGEYGMASASEPVIVNGFVYLAVNRTLLKIDAQTGKVLEEAPLASSISYTSRPVYAQGLIVIALDGGRVQALAADSLKTRWLTDEVSDFAQSSSTLTVRDGYVYVGTVDVVSDENRNTTYNNGTFTRINLLTGAISWRYTNSAEGYYWGGAAFSGDYAVIATSAGTVEVIDSKTGKLVSSWSLGVVVNSDCVASEDGSRVYLVSSDGKLHTFAVGEDGQITEPEPALDLGLETSKSTPTVVGGTMIVGGAVAGDHGALAVVDLQTGGVKLVTQADGAVLPAASFSGGGVKAAPLVSVQNGQTYVYFTTNGADGDWPNYTSGGGVYLYKLGDDEATMLYDAAGYHNLCDSPVVADAQGNLYYINDSGHLIALGHRTSAKPEQPENGNHGQGGPDGQHENHANPASKGGAPAAAHSPLTQGADKAGDAGQEAEKEAENKAMAKADKAARSKDSSAAPAAGTGADAGSGTPAGGTSAGVNPWAVGGIALGVVGLIGATGYVVRSRRRSGGAS